MESIIDFSWAIKHNTLDERYKRAVKYLEKTPYFRHIMSVAKDLPEHAAKQFVDIETTHVRNLNWRAYNRVMWDYQHYNKWCNS